VSEILELERQAEALKAEGKFQEAIDKLLELLKIDDKFARAHLALSVLYYKLKDAENSVLHGLKAIEVEPNDQFNYTALSVTCQRAFELTRDPKYIQQAEDAKARSHMF
jgi:tetratricopeptide (TPR) repeat protein